MEEQRFLIPNYLTAQNGSFYCGIVITKITKLKKITQGEKIASKKIYYLPTEGKKNENKLGHRQNVVRPQDERKKKRSNLIYFRHESAGDTVTKEVFYLITK